MAAVGLSFSDLCCLFCCPPWPSRIAAKLAFLPPEPSYSVDHDDTGSSSSECRMMLLEYMDHPVPLKETDKMEMVMTTTKRGNRIACLYVKCCPDARFTILHSHGNAVDLGQMYSFYWGLGLKLNCNIFSYDYSGYGVSSGKPSEKNLYADIDAAWSLLRTRFGLSPEKIILYGQSIGTVPTVDLASRFEVGAVVLHSALMSGMRVAFPQTKRTWFFDAFPSIDKIPKISSPVLVIHGTEDEVIDVSHGFAIYEKCSRAVEPLWVEGAGHNDVELYSHYLDRLRHFVMEELPSLRSLATDDQAAVANCDDAADGADSTSLVTNKRQVKAKFSANANQGNAATSNSSMASTNTPRDTSSAIKST